MNGRAMEAVCKRAVFGGQKPKRELRNGGSLADAVEGLVISKTMKERRSGSDAGRPAGMPSSISSVELNFLVFRYLHESGLTHSAFAMGYEAGINKSPIDGNLVPPGALVRFVQKGLQYVELEANLNSESDTDDFSFLQPMDLITKDVNELCQIILREKRECIKKKLSKHKEKVKEYDPEPETERARVRERGRQEREKEAERDKTRIERGRGREKEKNKEKQQDEHSDRDLVKDQPQKLQEGGGTKQIDVIRSSSFSSCEVLKTDVTTLEGHTSEVFVCAWSPTGSFLASGSGDATARIWTIADEPCNSNMQVGTSNVVVLKHKTIEKNRDVTTLDWNGDGTLLATGCYDGQARIWTRDGELKNTLNGHTAPVFSLKWSKKGDFLVSGSVDKTAIVWDMKTGEFKQQLEFFKGPILDVDWRNNSSFATSSADSMIYICKIGENYPIKIFSGHKGEVNAIRWDPTSSLLASCSDDYTAKIWSMKQDNCVQDLKEHTKEIYTLRWSPTGPSTPNPNQQLVLASASFDSTIKLWDVESGSVLHSLNYHSEPVYSVAFSPNGEYLASGSLDKSINIWSVRHGKVVKRYSGEGGIFEVCWNKEGNKLAAGFSNNRVCVLDFRM